jgi:hypothetical protein
MTHITCSVFGDDWIHLFGHPQFIEPILCCPECEAVWFGVDAVFQSEQSLGVTYIRLGSLCDLLNIQDFWGHMIDLGKWDQKTVSQKM